MSMFELSLPSKNFGSRSSPPFEFCLPPNSFSFALVRLKNWIHASCRPYHCCCPRMADLIRHLTGVVVERQLEPSHVLLRGHDTAKGEQPAHLHSEITMGKSKTVVSECRETSGQGALRHPGPLPQFRIKGLRSSASQRCGHGICRHFVVGMSPKDAN